VPGLGDFGERRCAYAWYGQEDTLIPFQVLCMICCLGVLFAPPTFPGLQWTMKTHRSLVYNFHYVLLLASLALQNE
jgi:hypothetical protein